MTPHEAYDELYNGDYRPSKSEGIAVFLKDDGLQLMNLTKRRSAILAEDLKRESDPIRRNFVGVYNNRVSYNDFMADVAYAKDGT